MFTVKTNFGQHRVVTSPNQKAYIYSQFPQDMRAVLAKLDSIETLLTQLVEITSAMDEQPAPKRARYENVSQSAFGSVVQDAVQDIREVITSVGGNVYENVIIRDIDLQEFQDYKHFVQGSSKREGNALKSSHFIATSEELEGFDEYLSVNPEKCERFRQFIQQKLYKCNDMEKLIRDLIADELFLEYNYTGTLGKKSLQNMILFETLLFETCFNGENQEEYIGEVKKIIHRAKNRIYKNRSLSKAKEALEAEIREINPENPIIESEAETLSNTFVIALHSDPFSSDMYPITDPLKLEALDRVLKVDLEKQRQFKQFLRHLMVKHEDPDKVLLELTTAELYLRYNYSGSAGKRPMKDMILFDMLFFETCFKDISHEEYIAELKRIILRNKNRAYKLTKQVETPKETLMTTDDEASMDKFETWLYQDLAQNDLAISKVFPIMSGQRLEALDAALKASPDLQRLLATQLTRLHDRFHSLDKVIQRIVADEVFMDYNYAGVWGKSMLKDMILFDKLLYEACFKAQPMPIYIKELVRSVQVAKNRIHRRNAERKKKGVVMQENEENVAQLECLLVEDALEEFNEELNMLEGKEDLNDSKLFPVQTAANLKALDRCLQADAERRQSFTHFLRKLGSTMEQAIERIIKDDIFLEYNFQGIKGKKSLCDLVLFDQVLYDAFGQHENTSFLKYVKRVKRYSRRASNRVNKKRAMKRKMLHQSSGSQTVQEIVGEDGDIITEDIDIDNEEIVTEAETDDSDEDVSS